MTAATLILPYRRASTIRVPKRDLVIGAADSLVVRVTIVETDDPSAQALEITGGIGGPSLRFFIWADWRSRADWTDYGLGALRMGDMLWSGTGVVASAAGSFDVAFPANTVSGWPRRCGFSVQLDWDGGTSSELLCEGALHIQRGWHGTVPFIPIDTDDGVNILLDDGIEILLA